MHDGPDKKVTAGKADLLEILVLALSVTAFWHYCYFLLAPWIWSRNLPYQSADITPWTLLFTKEHDGVEIYALYIMSFLSLTAALSLSAWLARLPGKKPRSIAIGVAAALSVVFLAVLGFTPPMNSLADTPAAAAVPQVVQIVLATAPAVALLYWAQLRSPRLALVLGALLLAPPCFLATSAFGWRDYTYVFAPALRLLDGARPSEIYFQYDLLPSLLAAAWMKLGLSLNSFRVVGQAGYYLALFGVFALSSRLFARKELSAFLLAALVLGRIYASPLDATLCFQTTPWRLDLWLPFLLVVYRFGPYHWLAGVAGGVILLLLKNFGIIYCLAYLQLLAALWLIGYLDSEKKVSLPESLKEHAGRALLPVAIMLVCGVASHFIFHNSEYGNFAGYYQKLGIGFIQIAKDSFYWYIFPLFSAVPVLIFRVRKSVSRQYLATALLLLFFAIGNSIYFFGRSHEHNILNIAIVLLFLFFLMLDLVGITLGTGGESGAEASFPRRHWAALVSSVLIAGIIVSYSGNIAKKGIIQATNVANGRTTYTTWRLPESFRGYMGKVREVTRNSAKLFFLDESDFVFYYYGGYAQSGYCNPLLTWIFNKDLQAYLQKLLDGGYYLVCSPSLEYQLKGLNYDYRTLVGDTVVVAKSSQGAPGR